jgi:hypothetical protein
VSKEASHRFVEGNWFVVAECKRDYNLMLHWRIRRYYRYDMELRIDRVMQGSGRRSSLAVAVEEVPGRCMLNRRIPVAKVSLQNFGDLGP